MSSPSISPDPYEQWDAAYVLGSLTPAERREYEDHVAGCAQCRRQLAELSGIPGLLGLLDSPATVEVSGASAVVPYAVFATKVRRRRAWQAAAAAAAVLALVTGTAAVTANLSDGSHTPPAAASPGTPGALAAPFAASTVNLHFASTGQTMLAATGTLRSQPWGTTISWTCTYAAGAVPAKPGYAAPTASKAYELVVTSTRGTQTVVATWHAGPGSTVSPVATTSIPAAQIEGVSIRNAGQETTLLNATP